MRLIRHPSDCSKAPMPCALTIGNFDGVHLGHQAILMALKKAAIERQLLASVMLFEPQPMEFFLGEQAPCRLYRLVEKIQILRDLSLPQLLVMRFGLSLAHLSARQFVTDILLRQLNMRYLLIGDDFRFGKDREGNYSLLTELANEYGFVCDRTDSVLQSNKRVSSTLIRHHLVAGELEKAACLLGRYYRMQGRVIHGQKLGRQLGWPTINIAVRRHQSPLHGIYVVRVYGVQKRQLDGVASIGTRPTINGGQWLLEVYLLNWQGECYGRRVEVEFIKRLRSEENFSSMDKMTRQIASDVEEAKAVFKQLNKPRETIR